MTPRQSPPQPNEDRRPSRPALTGPLRFAVLGASAAALLYALGAGAAYSWIRFGRGNSGVSVSDVALLRVGRVRHAMAEQQFADARAEFAERNLRAAYLAYATALRRDPDNVPGRIEAADFFAAAGSVKLEISTLEDGLARDPGSTVLAGRTFQILTSTGRDTSALDLIQRLYGSQPGLGNAATVEIYRILATLNSGDEAGAQRMLDAVPELRSSKQAPVPLAGVLWRLKEKIKAIEILSEQAASPTAPYPVFAQLVQWQELGGMASDALATAKQARERYPDEIPAKILVIEALANLSPNAAEVISETESFLKQTRGRPEALAALAEMAGRKGWVELSRNIFLEGAERQPDLRMLALYYADALAVNSRYDEEQRILADVEAQSDGDTPGFEVQLRRRQVMAAAARGDQDTVREKARFLAAAVQSSDPDNVDAYRRLFVRLGMKEAAAAFPTP